MHKDYIIRTYRKNETEIQEEIEVFLSKIKKRYPGVKLIYQIGSKTDQFSRHEKTLRIWSENLDLSNVSFLGSL